MAQKQSFFLVGILAFSLSSCATSDPYDGFSFDYSSAEIGVFDGIWDGRVDCSHLGFMPGVWVKIRGGRGEFGFGNRLAMPGSSAQLSGSLYADLDLQNGKIKWSGRLQPWTRADNKPVPEMPVSFRGQWREDKFILKGRIDKINCSGLIPKR